MAEPRQVLMQVRQVLQPGATFILEYANKRNLKAILRYLLRRQSWNPFDPEPVEFTALNFDFHPKAVIAWLHEAGFTVERQLTVSHFRMETLKRLVPLKLLVFMDSLAQLTGNWWQLSPSVFLLANAIGDTPTAQPGTFFRCPACDYYPLRETSAGAECQNCSRKWPLEDGIYDFRQR
jgi:hypothetical protein